MGLVPDHPNKGNRAIKPSRNLFTGRESCLPFVNYVTPVKYNRVKRNQTRYAYTCILKIPV